MGLFAWLLKQANSANSAEDLESKLLNELESVKQDNLALANERDSLKKQLENLEKEAETERAMLAEERKAFEAEKKAFEDDKAAWEAQPAATPATVLRGAKQITSGDETIYSWEAFAQQQLNNA
jgi:predicted  nucleic acid-binding Zn-ribbon protein